MAHEAKDHVIGDLLPVLGVVVLSKIGFEAQFIARIDLIPDVSGKVDRGGKSVSNRLRIVAGAEGGDLEP